MCQPTERLAIGLRDTPARKGGVTVKLTDAVSRYELISQEGGHVTATGIVSFPITE